MANKINFPDTFIPAGAPIPPGLFQPAVNHFFTNGLYSKESHLPAGSVFVQHKHKYDHLSILARGDIILDIDGVAVPMSAPQCLIIEAGKHHGVKAVTDVVWYCIHATDDPTDENLAIDLGDVGGAGPIVERLKGV